MYGNTPGSYGGGYGGRMGDVGGPAGERREPGLVLVFSMLTCGIYYLWWVAKVSEEIQRYTNEPDTSPTMEVILTICTFGVYNVYWDYKIAKKIARMQQGVGLPVADNATLYLVLDILGIGVFNSLMQQGHLNDVWYRAGQAVPQR